MAENKIIRHSLDLPLEARYSAWSNKRERLAPKSVDFLNNDYVNGFTQRVVPMGNSEIRDIAQGGSGGNFKFGNENRIPQKNSNSIRGTYGVGPAQEIQTEFKQNATTQETRFTAKGLSFIDRDSRWTGNKKYSPGGGPSNFADIR